MSGSEIFDIAFLTIAALICFWSGAIRVKTGWESWALPIVAGGLISSAWF